MICLVCGMCVLCLPIFVFLGVRITVVEPILSVVCLNLRSLSLVILVCFIFCGYILFHSRYYYFDVLLDIICRKIIEKRFGEILQIANNTVFMIVLVENPVQVKFAKKSPSI